uniref:Pectinesterase inhibitor domain-containing protein n=2 Tax=Aegilops tauschii subsp. strangulata TaxID=200361 RepID=A0A453AAX5_AEGTS
EPAPPRPPPLPPPPPGRRRRVGVEPPEGEPGGGDGLRAPVLPGHELPARVRAEPGAARARGGPQPAPARAGGARGRRRRRAQLLRLHRLPLLLLLRVVQGEGQGRRRHGGLRGDGARRGGPAEAQSAAELGGRVGRASSPRFAWCLSNVQTWASAALTDAETCLDSLAASAGAGAPREDVRRRVVAVEQAAGVALALVNRLQPARRPAAAVHQ